MHSHSRLIRMTAVVFVCATLLVVGISPALAADKCETFHANAMGTSTQLGKIFPVKFWFCKPSTPEERQALADAFKKGKNQGLTRHSRRCLQLVAYRLRAWSVMRSLITE